MEEQYGEPLVQSALGSGVKKLAPSEQANYGRTNRSLHFLTAMSKGTIIKESDVSVLRTEKVLTPGISPLHINDILGAVLVNDVKAGAGVQWADVIQR